jgi:hypothetical protein
MLMANNAAAAKVDSRFFMAFSPLPCDVMILKMRHISLRRALSYINIRECMLRYLIESIELSGSPMFS